MEYTVNQLAKLAGVSARTLHYYDEIGLLKPSFVKENGYRCYQEKELLRLQQILFFRELDFSLEQIIQMLNSPDFDLEQALRAQRKLIQLKKARLAELEKTIGATIRNVKKGKSMDSSKLFAGFDQDPIDQYKQEVQERWGQTEPYKQSTERMKHWTKADYARVEQDSHELTASFAQLMERGAADPQVQKLVARHHKHIEQFYDCPYEMYRALGQTYVDDPRFAKNYDSLKPGLAQFVRDAIAYYCDSRAPN